MKKHRIQQIGLGMRTLKTGLGVFLALWVTELLGFQGSSLAAITTIVAVQPSLKGSMETVKQQLVATTFGCILATIAAYYFHGSYLAIAISVIMAIVLCVRLDLREALDLVLITIIIIGQTPLDNFAVTIIQRITMLGIGLGIGFGLNLLVVPEYGRLLKDQVENAWLAFEALYHDCVKALIITNQVPTPDTIQERVANLQVQLRTAEKTYTLVMENRLQDKKAVVQGEYDLLKKMIDALRANTERLAEVVYSIAASPSAESEEALKENIYQYLMEIFENHHKIYRYLRYDEALEQQMIIRFDQREEALEKILIDVIGEVDNLKPIHYCNIVSDAERIMLRTWRLVEDKGKIYPEKSMENMTNKSNIG